jgi:1-acyl-sn-glycerol-3-phosphate acyltransferase
VFFRWAGVIPVDRDRKNSRALDATTEKLKKGKLIGIFPEGTINHSLTPLPFKFGAARMAQKAGVPVIPAVINGKYSIFKKNSIKITFGKPIRISKNLERTNRELWDWVKSHREEVR